MAIFDIFMKVGVLRSVISIDVTSTLRNSDTRLIDEKHLLILVLESLLFLMKLFILQVTFLLME